MDQEFVRIPSLGANIVDMRLYHDSDRPLIVFVDEHYRTARVSNIASGSGNEMVLTVHVFGEPFKTMEDVAKFLYF